MSTATQSTVDNHNFRPRDSSDSRSPCPALNTLANHGYIPRNGKGITFVQLIRAMVLVYNISYPLAFLLASAGFLTTGGKPSFPSYHGMSSNSRTESSLLLDFFSRCINSVLLAMHTFLRPSWTLDLESLCQRGPRMIAHDGAFVHSDGKSSSNPDPTLLENLLQQAATARDSKGNLKGGLDFVDIARIHTKRALSTAHPALNNLHSQVSLGECSLIWEVFRVREGPLNGIIPTSKIQQWLGEERLPDGWWEGTRPKETTGLLRARKTANEVAKLSKEIVTGSSKP